MGEGDARTEGYWIGDALPVSVDAIDPGTNLLVSGPAMSGKRRLLLDLIAPETTDLDPIVVVTTDEPATRVEGDLLDRGVELGSATCHVIDASGAPGDEDPAVRRISSPADLTSLGVAFTNVVDEMGNPTRLRAGFHSISTLLQYVDTDRTFSFLHVLSRRSSAAGYLGVYSIDPTTHEDRFVNVITSIFDAVVEIREDGGDRQLRVRGLPDVTAEWTSFPY